MWVDSGFFRDDARTTRCPQLGQSWLGKASRVKKDSLGEANNDTSGLKGGLFRAALSTSEMIIRATGIARFGFYLHERVAVVNKWSVGDLLEDLADVWQWLGLLDQSLVVMDQRQSHTEQDFRALVEQAIPNPQNGLQRRNQTNPTSYFKLELLDFCSSISVPFFCLQKNGWYELSHQYFSPCIIS